MREAVICFFLFLGLVGCRPDSGSHDERPFFFEQNFKTDVAWVVVEWNGKPYTYGSGFLINKERGIFFTNKHVSKMFDGLGSGSQKVFFNGKIYNAVTVKTAPLSDAALVSITDRFQFSDFPEPSPVATEPVKVGDRVIVEGFHPHPHAVRKADEAAGYKFPTLNIFRGYYGLTARDLEKETEIVFERLEATISAVDKKAEISDQGSGVVQGLRNLINLHIEIKTDKDHRFSFGGLSGTVVRNKKGETIGIFTAGPEVEFDPDTKQDLPDGGFVANRVFKTGLLTPMRSVDDLVRFIK
ncbi:MAG: hypothetical protein A3B99_02130 [Candidatus Yanofskybacteria bacterium RIFCSPHIGHO2_02_FULL_44_12b]|uniref:Serine protease n=2 Tax=Candidatus Yanofskyibacteriota TaxID=1752733 RepID=A0A1F8GR61_9BACT|nr:MAG: hypothetical protein UW79_C0012G0017 [Candidatus Yanofskybacteria bacterium GW2011_GWA2_44_9]OGN05198.1 MAG: hypothetical protein A2659_04205 [Candidatus Yanofskybacteria bacterium RIFCSPHIGHO2_01_FULL_44_24]OGN15256.1 MAG: hypothetical protein A3B99_02130 [Candidatus Yanofskybacteria bacterium RIFCSPHIGHO2_02_FULL_44_12b]OGN26919.1 MAG: hypothetical protein A2925_01465 [Candidatus Yanofskybacteria bacterium RIFCSPLOWO2_01_FULL_44_22]